MQKKKKKMGGIHESEPLHEIVFVSWMLRVQTSSASHGREYGSDLVLLRTR